MIRKQQLKVTFICALMIAAVVGSSVGIPLGFAQLSPYRLLLIVLAAGMAVLWTNRIREEKPLGKPDRTTLLLLIWLAYALFSLLWVEDKTAWFKAIFFLGSGIITALAIRQVIKTRQEFEAVLNVLVFCAFVVTLLGWYELYSQSSMFITTLDEFNKAYYAYNKNPVLWFGNANNLALYLVISFFFVYLRHQTAKHIVARSALAVLMVLITGLLVQTSSRASLLGLLLGIVILLLYHTIQIVRRKKRFLSMLAALGMVVILTPLPRMLLYGSSYAVALEGQVEAFGLGINIDWESAASDISIISSSKPDGLQNEDAGKPFKYNNKETAYYATLQELASTDGLSSEAKEPGVASSEGIRINLIVNGLDILKRTKFLGTGAGNLELWISKDSALLDTYSIRNMHNFWAEVLVTYGLFIFLPLCLGFAALGVLFLRHAWLRKALMDKALAISMAAAMGAFFLASISPSSILSSEYFWASFGLVMSGGDMLGSRQQTEDAPLPKRVVFISALDLWSMAEKKGAPSFYNTVKGYIDAGWQVSLVKPIGTSRKWYSLTGYKQLGFWNSLFEYFYQFRIIGSLARFLSAKYCTRQFYRLAAGELEETPGLIYAYEVHAVEAGKRLRDQYNLPLVTRFQGTIMAEHPKTLLNRYRYYPHIQALSQNSDTVIMTNDGTFGESILKKFGNRSPVIHFWRNGVIRYEKNCGGALLRQRLGIASEHTVLLTVSRVVRWKRIDRAIRALASALPEHPDTVLVIVGSGPAIPYNQALAKALKVEQKVHFMGAVPHQELYAYYDMADVFLSLYDLGNVGNPIMEAMVMGKPILTINNGDTQSLMGDSEYGLMVANTDQQAINQGLKTLLSQPELARQYGKAAERYAVKNLWTWEERIVTEICETSRLLARNNKRVQ